MKIITLLAIVFLSLHSQSQTLDIIKIETPELATPKLALAEFSKLCLQEKETLNSNVFIESLVAEQECTEPNIVSGDKRYKAKGTFIVRYNSSLYFGSRTIRTSFYPSQEEAFLDWRDQCLKYLNTRSQLEAKYRIYENCGTPYPQRSLNSYYIQTTTVKVFRLKPGAAMNEYY